MSAEESAEGRQDNELEALKSIYAEDLKDNRRKAAWNRWTPLDVILSLRPQQGSSGVHEAYVTLELRIICPETYPITGLPTLQILKSKGLSHGSLFELQNSLEKKAKDLEGQEMIFLFAQLVEEFLHSNNKPPSKSLHEQMLTRLQIEEEEDLQAKVLAEDREREKIKREVEKRQEILKSETRRFREKRYSSENSPDDMGRLSISNNSPDDSDDCLCGHKKAVLIEFSNRQVQRGQCLRHCSFNHTVFIAIDVQSGEILLLSEWIIENAKQLANLEQEYNYMSRFRHPNLINFLNLKCEHQSNGSVIVYIIKEFVNGPNCTYFINENFNLSIQFIKYISKGVLTALDYLHRNNVVHKDIRDGCVYINQKGVVLLSNYSLHRRLTDLCSSSSNNLSTNYSKKTDIRDFGIFIISLLQGEILKGKDADTIPKSIPSDLRDFLINCVAQQEKERFTTHQLLMHSFLSQSLLAVPSPRHRNEQNIHERNVSPDVITHELAEVQQGQSRIRQDFEFLDNLGKGAFGDVIKARNNLDGGYYAIKRIKLNPKNRQLNKKIVREVKLLSRLNHENIVRYYNSWIETTTIKDDDSEESSTTSSDFYEKGPKIIRPDELTLNDNIEELAPSIKNFETAVTYDSMSQPGYDSSSEDESSDDESSWGARVEEEQSSYGIEFERDDNETSVIEQPTTSTKSPQSKASSNEHRSRIDFLYIQMEFCEKSTLRNAIDNSIYLDEARVCRLFRETVEGLVHIHQQGMIHRDLKPVNIFLDACDHVKIGDFGLATNINTKLNEYGLNMTLPVETEETMDESKTGLIGTALYVAPELGLSIKANYNQKVDIYSLGIILFEMSYKPLSTGMERIKILTGLRQKEVILPQSFAKENPKQATLIKWLLNHDVAKRPSSQQLLQSEHVPPPVVEECHLRDLIRHTLSNTQLKGYKYLIASCFNQRLPEAQDITYDRDPSGSNVNKPLELYEYVKGNIIKIFKQHGGQNLSTPLLMPRSGYYEDTESYVKLMTHFGGIVSLPHDLRVPFARYVAWNNLSLIRRFSIERVYREKKVFGFLPRELYECAFDIVTPTPGNLMADAELLYLFFEIVNELPAIKNKQITIRLNHSLLLKAILLHFGIKEKHQEVLQMFSDAREGKVPRGALNNFLISFGLSDHFIATLTNIFNSEFEVNKASNQFQMIIKKRSSEASTLAKQALQDLKCIANNAEAFGVTFDIVIAPGVIYNVRQFSGVIFQFVCELRKKHKHGYKEVLAAGGRYDAMIHSYKRMMETASMSGKDIQQSAVGISLSLDKLIQTITREENEDLPKFSSFDVAVSSVGTKPMTREKTKILRDLWTVGIRAVLIEPTNNEDIQEQCMELNVPYIIMLKDRDQGVVPVRIWERGRYQEKSFKIGELIENLQRLVRNSRDGPSHDLTPSMTTTSRENRDHNCEVDILFIANSKFSASVRKRHDRQIRKNLEDVFKKLSGVITVLAVNCNTEIIRTIGAYLECETEQQFQKSVQVIIEKHQRDNSYLSNVCKEIFEHKFRKTKPAIVLFNLSDSFYRLIL